MSGVAVILRRIRIQYGHCLRTNINLEECVRLHTIKVAAKNVKKSCALVEKVGEVIYLRYIILSPDIPLHQLEVKHVEHGTLVQISQI